MRALIQVHRLARTWVLDWAIGGVKPVDLVAVRAEALRPRY